MYCVVQYIDKTSVADAPGAVNRTATFYKEKDMLKTSFLQNVQSHRPLSFYDGDPFVDFEYTGYFLLIITLSIPEDMLTAEVKATVIGYHHHIERDGWEGVERFERLVEELLPTYINPRPVTWSCFLHDAYYRKCI